MNTRTRILSRLAPLALTVLLAACATPDTGEASGAQDHQGHHSKSSSAMPPSPGAGLGMRGSMDMKSMCDMHKKMMGGKSQAERDAMMERMKSMPQMCRQHMEAMESHCKST